MQSGQLIGYDPGGDGTHGIAVLTVEDGKLVSGQTCVLSTANDVIDRIASTHDLLALGIDTLTCWSTGRCGWRPADRWLRDRYPIALRSVVSPNGLYGSMGLNGMAVLIAAKAHHPAAQITETHPKVLYCHLTGCKYNWDRDREAMTRSLGKWVSHKLELSSEHEWDAALSAFAAFQGLIGRWPTDLHELPVGHGERLIKPAGDTHYYWPS